MACKSMLVVVTAVLMVIVPMQKSALAQQCSTSSTAPKLSDVNSCLSYLKNLGTTRCCQQNSPNGACTSMCYYGTAVVDICGTTLDCTTCSTAADGLSTISNKCSDNYGGVQRVSGTTSYAGFT